MKRFFAFILCLLMLSLPIACGKETPTPPVDTGDGMEDVPPVSDVPAPPLEFETLNVELAIEGMAAQTATGRMLHGRMDQYNDFDNAPLAVETLEGISIADGKVIVTLPPCTVAALELR